MMKRNIQWGAGLALVLILGFWGWNQSKLHLELQPEKDVFKVLEVTPRRAETPHDPPPLSSADLNQLTGEKAGSVSGTVRVKFSGSPVVGASVQARNGEIPFESPLVYTDEKGSYTLTGMPSSIRLFILYVNCPSGEYYLNWPRDDGGTKSEDDPPVISLKPGENKSGVNINVLKGQPGTIAGTVVARNVSYLPPCDPPQLPEREAAELAEEIALSGVRIILKETPWGKQETVTDKSGHFRFENLKQATYTICVEKPDGFVDVPNSRPSFPVILTRKPVQEDLKFCFLQDGVSVEGRVLDSKGQPIEGAEIIASQSPYMGPGSLWARGDYSEGYRDLELTRAFSNVKGEFRLSNLPVFSFNDGVKYLRKGEYAWEFRLLCAANGFSPNSIAFAPFPNALIQAVMKDEEERIKTAEPEINMKYADVNLPSGQGNVITGVEVVLFSRGSVSGRVVDKQGRDLLSADEEQHGGASIHLIPEESSGVRIPLGARLEEGSCFHIENVPPGRYNLSVEWAYYQGISGITARAKNESLVVKEGETIQDLIIVVESMADRGDIVGHVVDALTGQPVESLSVKVLRMDSPSEPEPQKGQISIDNLPVGDFSIRSLSAGKVTLEFAAPGYRTVQAEADVSSGQTTEQTFKLGEGGILSGRVLDAETKEPIKKFEVKVTQADGETKGQSVEGKIQMDQNTTGTFCLTGIPAGRVTVEVAENTAHPNSYKKVSTHSDAKEEFEIVSGKTTEHSFLLERKGSLIGRVTVNGEVLKDPKSKVHMNAYRNGRIEEKSPQFEINDQGEYKSEETNTGTYMAGAILKYNYGYKMGTEISIQQRAEVEVEPGKETRQDFDFQGTASIQGVFHASDRELSWSFEVVEGSFPEGNWKDPEYRRKTRATVWNLQKGDRYEVRYLSPGIYTLVARCFKQGDENPVCEKRQMVTLTDGQATTVDFEFP